MLYNRTDQKDEAAIGQQQMSKNKTGITRALGRDKTSFPRKRKHSSVSSSSGEACRRSSNADKLSAEKESMGKKENMAKIEAYLNAAPIKVDESDMDTAEELPMLLLVEADNEKRFP